MRGPLMRDTSGPLLDRSPSAEKSRELYMAAVWDVIPGLNIRDRGRWEIRQSVPARHYSIASW